MICGRSHYQFLQNSVSGNSLVSQMVKNPPAMQETWVRSLGWEDPPWRRAYSCLENPVDRGAWQATVHGVTKGRTGPSGHSTAHILFNGLILIHVA